MPDNYQQLQQFVRKTFDVLLVVIGLCFITGTIDLSLSQIWLPLLLILTGILILSPSAGHSPHGGVLTLALGVYLLLRVTDVISVSILGYIFGIFFVLFGAANLIRSSKGGDVPLSKTLSKQSND